MSEVRTHLEPETRLGMTTTRRWEMKEERTERLPGRENHPSTSCSTLFPGTRTFNCWSDCSCFLPEPSRLQADEEVSDLSPKAGKGSDHLGWEASLLAHKPESLRRSGSWRRGETPLISAARFITRGKATFKPAFRAGSGRAVNEATGA